MMEQAIYILASVSLLATPGPTNTLLATSGAAIGIRRSLPLLAAELVGYFLAIAMLRGLVGPVIAAIPAFGTTLRVLVIAYLIHLAVKLWWKGSIEIVDCRPVTFFQVLVTTILNPKGVIFAFAILPQDIGVSSLLPWLGTLGLCIVAIGSCWIAGGTLLHRCLKGYVPSHIGFRVSAVALILLASGIGVHALK